MGHTSTMITANGGVDFRGDIAAVLNLNTGVLKDLCLASNINPWAKYKPVAASAIVKILRNDSASLGLGNAARTALGPPAATTVQALINLYADGESNTLGSGRANGWRYWKPRGRSYSEWYRSLDFVKIVSVGGVLTPALNSGYEHLAKNPFGNFTCSASVSRIGGTMTARNNVVIPTTGLPDENIAIEDINAYLGGAQKMSYYGVLLVPQSGSGACYLVFNNAATISANNTGSDYVRGGESLVLDPYVLTPGIMTLGTYTVYPFLTNMKIDQTARFIAVTNRNSSITSDVPRLYPLPGTTPGSMIIYDTLVVIEVHADAATGSLLTTEIYIEITNNGDSAVTISSLVMKWRTSTSSFTAERRTNEVYFDGQFRYDDNYPTGIADGSYSTMLKPATPFTVQPGATLRIPGSGLSLSARVPNRSANVLFIGRPDQTAQYGYTTVQLPAGT